MSKEQPYKSQAIYDIFQSQVKARMANACSDDPQRAKRAILNFIELYQDPKFTEEHKEYFKKGTSGPKGVTLLNKWADKAGKCIKESSRRKALEVVDAIIKCGIFKDEEIEKSDRESYQKHFLTRKNSSAFINTVNAAQAELKADKENARTSMQESISVKVEKTEKVKERC